MLCLGYQQHKEGGRQVHGEATGERQTQTVRPRQRTHPIEERIRLCQSWPAERGLHYQAINEERGMVAHVHLFDETSRGQRTPVLVLDVPSSTTTVRDVIAGRVAHEVAVHEAQTDRRRFRGLVQPTGSAPTPDGYALEAGRRLDAQAQIESAWGAFERNGFFMLVDDVQVESLDQVIELGASVNVSFLKLIPLVGG